MLIVNTGNGKGKTTSAIGQIIRNLGHGYKVCLLQLFKDESFYGEQKILKKLKNLDFYSFAPKHPFCFSNLKKQTVKKQCQNAIKHLKKIITAKKPYNLIVLDEFNIGLRDKFIKLEDLLRIFKRIPVSTTVVITGRGAPQRLIKAADIATEMKEIKHAYNKGVMARLGVEF